MKQNFLRMMYALALSSGIGLSAMAQTLTLDLTKPLNPESFTFDPATGQWTETYNDTDYPFIDFEDFSFSHLIDGDGWGGSYWDGFTVCTSGDNTDFSSSGSSGWVANQWGNMAGGGIKTDANGNVLKDETGKVQVAQGIPYLLGYCSIMSMEQPCQIILTGNNAPYEAIGVYINASPWPYYGNAGGDSFARALDQDGDYFKLIIHGLDDNYKDNNKTVDYYLAKNEGGGIENLRQSPDWEWVDLSPLGEVYGFYFTMDSSDTDPLWGMNTSAHFCMDKLQVKVSGSITGMKTSQTKIAVYPNPFAEYIMVESANERKAAIYDLSGKPVLTINVQTGNNTLNTSALPKGVYLLNVEETTIKIVK